MKSRNIILIAIIILLSTSVTISYALTAKKPLKTKVITLDPGHGGYDPGTTWGDIKEKDINLFICKEVKKQLEKTGAKVVMTRDKDYNLAVKGLRGIEAKRYDLGQRVAQVSMKKADILITIHVNSTTNQSIQGAEAFYHPSSQKGEMIATSIQNELRKIPGMKKRLAKKSNCFLLRNSKVPAVLVEVGYLSNPYDRELLQQPKYLKSVSRKVSTGLINALTKASDESVNK